MKTPSLLKVFTISLFVILIVLFVVYRSGGLPDIAMAGNETANTKSILAQRRLDTVPAAFRDSVLKAHKETKRGTRRILISQVSARYFNNYDRATMKLQYQWEFSQNSNTTSVSA